MNENTLEEIRRRHEADEQQPCPPSWYEAHSDRKFLLNEVNRLEAEKLAVSSNHRRVYANITVLLGTVDSEMQQNPTPMLFQLYKQLVNLEEFLRSKSQDNI